MPVLSNPKRELFAQARAKGAGIEDAYEQSGYKRHRGNAHRMSENEDVKRRVAELQRRGAERAEVTIADITADLRRLAQKAEAMEGPAAVQAARACRMDIAKLNGLVVEHTHNVYEKRDATDWSREELVAILNDAGEGGRGTAETSGRDGEPDQLH